MAAETSFLRKVSAAPPWRGLSVQAWEPGEEERRWRRERTTVRPARELSEVIAGRPRPCTKTVRPARARPEGRFSPPTSSWGP